MTGEKRDCACPRARHEHGTWHAYRADHCRCAPCRTAWANYTRHSRSRIYLAGSPLLVDACGTARRLQALSACGWSSRDIADRLGTQDTIVREWMNGKIRRVTLRTRSRVAKLYDDVWDQPAPGPYSAKIRRAAAAKGWAAPLDWDDDRIDVPDHAEVEDIVHADFVDEIAVDKAIAGRRVRLTKPELSAAIRKMTDMGYSAESIGERLGTSSRLVQRYRNGVAA